MRILKKFERNKAVRSEANKHGITKTLFQRSMTKLKKVCSQDGATMSSLQLRHVLHGIASDRYPIEALFPFFIEHSNRVYPALKPHRGMKEICDLSEPTLWYPKARAMKRKIIFHAGPTNSGKTHAAMERFYEVDRAVYCSPLRLLAREICEKSRSRGVSCDMITGDDRDYAHGSPSRRSDKAACTVEMTDLETKYDVAVIDEIQMMSDIERGWAWTRAFLGLCAAEIHVCGEERALELVGVLTEECRDRLTIIKYRRLGKLRVKKKPVETLERLRPGDCIVCFNRDQIFSYKRRLEEEGREAAIIYGDLPPQTKREEAIKFNDPDHPCDILITTDAIGMGLNLNIKRIIFNDIKKTTVNKRGDRRMERLTPSQALQISGRAGRFGSQYPDGAVTAMHVEHQKILLGLLKQNTIKLKRAGLHPSFDRLQRFAKVMQSKSLHDVLSVFISMSETDKSLYFLCSLKDCQEIAEELSRVKLSLRDAYTFCLSPISMNRDFVVAALRLYAEFYSRGFALTAPDVKAILKWPPRVATNRKGISKLEDIHECLRLYLWLSYRFPEIFSNSNEIRAMRSKVDYLTKQSVSYSSNSTYR